LQEFCQSGLIQKSARANQVVKNHPGGACKRLALRQENTVLLQKVPQYIWLFAVLRTIPVADDRLRDISQLHSHGISSFLKETAWNIEFLPSAMSSANNKRNGGHGLEDYSLHPYAAG